MKTIGTLFTGFGGVDLGAHAAGFTSAWGIEYDADIAAVAQANGLPVTVADILECDPFDFEPVDVLHASPPCPNFSVAKAGAEETEHDIAMGRKVAEFVDVLRPSLFTLENVYGYRKAQSFRHIVKRLRRLDYHVKWWHLNSADYGVPQTRKRLILVAALDFTPQRPPATHQEPGKHEGQLALFGDKLPPWVGWYEAIEDLIPSLPDSEFAPWQLERLPDELRTMLLSQGISRNHHNEDYGIATNRREDEAAFTITSNQNMQTVRAFVMWSNGNMDSWGRHHVEEAEPALTVSPQTNGRARAFVVDQTNHRGENGKSTIRDKDNPLWTVPATYSTKHPPPRAFVVASNSNADSWGDNYREGETPQFTVTERDNGRSRAAVAGRVVQMTPRALARFQSFPDNYELPDSKTLACRGIGNACPPLLMQRIYERLLVGSGA